MNNEYEHGANIYQFAEIANCKENEVIDFSSNVNCISPDIDLNISVEQIKAYPDINYSKLKKSIKQHYNIKNGNYDVELFNGASSGIYSFFRLVKEQSGNRKVNLYAPIYLEYKKIAKILNMKINTINRLNNITGKIDKNSIVIFVNPATPDGKLYNTHKLIEYWQKQNCTILIDESFLDFTKTQSIMQYINKYQKLFILRSFTKFYGFAGTRIGLIASSKNNIKELRKSEPPWKLSAFDSVTITKCLKEKNFYEKSYNINEINKQLLINTLTKSNIFTEIYPSDANFILVKMKQSNAAKLQTLLTPYKIYIRNCQNFDFLDSSFVRFAVKEKQDIQKLNYALKNIAKKLH